MIFLRQSYRNWKGKKELDKNRKFEESPISMLKNTEEENFGEDCICRFANRPQLVRHVSDSVEEDEKPVTSSRLLDELQRPNASYNPDAKSELNRLDGLSRGTATQVGLIELKWLI